MKLFNVFSERGYHTTIISTFGIDFSAYESIVLARLREAGCNNNILVADARMLGLALKQNFGRPKFAGKRYSVVGASAEGVFHPKLILQIGRSSGRILVASANMTVSGIAGNLEIVGQVSVDEDDLNGVPVLRAAFAYLAGFISQHSVAGRQLDWAMKRAIWLSKSEPTEPIINLSEGGRLEFISSGIEQGIGARFVELIGNRRVNRIIVMSPYWDFGLVALRELQGALRPHAISILIQPARRLFPAISLAKKEIFRFFDADQITGMSSSRFTHAKIIIVETSSGDCMLYGSANCTTAALGKSRERGVNEEACLYLELKSGEAARVLGLADALDATLEISADSLPPYQPEFELPLADLEQRLPGRFELSGNVFRWWPPCNLAVVSSKITLLDHDGRTIISQLSRIGEQTAPAMYTYSGNETPAFAQVNSSGKEYVLAIVLVESEIQLSQRQTFSKSETMILADLQMDDVFEGLWLLEIIQKLELAEQNQLRLVPRDAIHIGSRGDVPKEVAGTTKLLTFDEFVAGRKGRRDHDEKGLSQFGASNLESVRALLNSLIGKVEWPPRTIDEPLDGSLNFSLGDETSDADSALDNDEAFKSDNQITRQSVDEEKYEEQRRKHRHRVRTTQGMIVKDVERFFTKLREKSNSMSLSGIDLLRLRAIVMVILWAGTKASSIQLGTPSQGISVWQVLPSKGEQSWRMMVGKLIYGFFRQGSKSGTALISMVVVEDACRDGSSVDVLECIATCCWAICAVQVALDDDGVVFQPTAHLYAVSMELYGYAGVLTESPLSGTFKVIFEGMAQRYGDRLGANSADVIMEHERKMASVRQKMQCR